MIRFTRALGYAIGVTLLCGYTLACVLPQQLPVSDGTAYEPFRPPTAALPILVIGVPQESPPIPTPVVDCTNELAFIADLTIPDGTSIAPGSTLDKQWEVENRGTCNWDYRYRLRLIAGSPMGVPAEQALFPARSGSRAMIRILFTSPLEAGSHRSVWQAVNPAGQLFGDQFYIDIIVSAP